MTNYSADNWSAAQSLARKLVRHCGPIARAVENNECLMRELEAEALRHGKTVVFDSMTGKWMLCKIGGRVHRRNANTKE